MRRLFLLLSLLVAGVLLSGVLMAGDAIERQQAPAPTLVPPTPVPFAGDGDFEILPSDSVVARLQSSEVLRVGILYNAPPFGELNIRGEVSGYDADVARSIGDTWGLPVEFVQVTRDVDRSADMLRDGAVDFIAGAFVHRREYDNRFEFSQTYYLGGQHVMVRVDDPVTTPAELGGRTLGVVIGTPGEGAVVDWQRRSGVGVNVQTFLTLDRAYSALAQGQIDGVVETSARLLLVSEAQPDTIRVLDEALQLEPHTIAIQRQDANMRNLVNRTLQYLTSTGRMQEIYQVHFPGGTYDLTPPWLNLGEDAPTPAQFGTDIPFPDQYVIPQMQSTGTIRVAGLIGVTADSDAPESDRRLDTFHRALIGEMASRWGVNVEFVPNSANNPLEFVANGQADIAVNVQSDWAQSEVVDFTTYYLLRGERLLVQANDDVNNFSGLRGGQTVATPNNEPTAATRAVEIAGTVPVSIEILQVREQDIAFTILEEGEAEVAFGDSIRLLPHAQAFPQGLRLTTAEDRGAPMPWYSQTYLYMAVPRNDIDFRLLLEYSLQELVLDGTLRQLLQPLMLPEDIPTFEVWPGSSTYLGYSLGS
ncbi:MAG: transporter substrate-binding domain-containing protein [Aggregatilineales bacterium]